MAAPAHTGNTRDDPSDDLETAASRRVPDVEAVIDAELQEDDRPYDSDPLIASGISMEVWETIGAEDLIAPYTDTRTGDAPHRRGGAAAEPHRCGILPLPPSR